MRTQVGIIQFNDHSGNDIGITNGLIALIIGFKPQGDFVDFIDKEFKEDKSKQTLYEVIRHYFIVSGTLAGIIRFAMTLLIPIILGYNINLLIAKFEGILSYSSIIMFGIFIKFIKPFKLDKDDDEKETYHYLLYFLISIGIIFMGGIYLALTKNFNKQMITILFIASFGFFSEAIIKHGIIERWHPIPKDINHIYYPPDYNWFTQIGHTASTKTIEYFINENSDDQNL